MAGLEEAERGDTLREADAWRTHSDAPSPPVALDDVASGGASLAALRRIEGQLRHGLLQRRDMHSAFAEERAHGHFFLFVPVFLGAGAALWFAALSDPSILALLVIASATFWPALRLRHREDWLALAAGAAFLVPVGMLLAAFESARLDTVLLDAPVTTQITGRVLSRESDEREAIRYRIALTTTQDPTLKRVPAVVTVLARSKHEPIAIGDGISGRARLNPPSGPALAGLNDFAFDAY